MCRSVSRSVILSTILRLHISYASDGVKDTYGKAKAKDISHKAKAKAKDLTLKAKAKDIQHKPKNLCHMAIFPCGGTSCQEVVLAHQACDKNAPLALLHLVRMETNRFCTNYKNFLCCGVSTNIENFTRPRPRT